MAKKAEIKYLLKCPFCHYQANTTQSWKMHIKNVHGLKYTIWHEIIAQKEEKERLSKRTNEKDW
jgi:uncharacterized C2H2 Zn-finger protein